MASGQILKVIGGGDALGFGGSEKVLSHTIGMVSKGDLDGAIEPMEVPVVTSTLVCLVLLHKRNQLLGRPTFSLEVIIV